jgi:phage gpG-like protein
MKIEVLNNNCLMALAKEYQGLKENVKTGIERAVEAMAGFVDEELARGTWNIKSRTGGLRNSIGSRVLSEGGSWVGLVGTNLVYARIQEVGGEVTVTAKMKGKMFAMYREQGNPMFLAIALKKVGSKMKIPAHFYMRQTAEKYQGAITGILERAIA